MKKQVFLGGACGETDWRRNNAIPAFEKGGITYYNPQLGVGEWTEECEAAEMKAKAEAEVLLFVVNEQTRGVASLAEAAYLLAARQPLALVVKDVADGAQIGSQIIGAAEKDDLNRGRIFVRTMAAIHNVPVFDEVEAAVDYAIEFVKTAGKNLSLEQVRDILRDVKFKDFEFLVQTTDDGFHLQIRCEENDALTGEPVLQTGRKWFIEKSARPSEIVQTAFKAVVTWQEHEAREHFRYREAGVFSPHFNISSLVKLWKEKHAAEE